MNVKITFALCFLTGSLLLASCARSQPSPTAETNMPNPASVYCEENGGKVDLRQDASGGVAGVCVFPDGSECDEWAYYRKECQPGQTPAKTAESIVPAATETPPLDRVEIAEDGCKVYRNEGLGYSFHYPANTKIIVNDDPTKSISIVPENEEGWPSITISHPSDREEFRPPQGVDLMQWLTDRYLLGEERMPDEQIAGTTAIHFRQRSPQSYADDRYYFAKDGQLFLVLIGHADDKEDWQLYDHFLGSIQFEG